MDSASVSLAYKEANRERFETDLEFVQCLANPFYLQTLAQQAILSSEPFLNYLKHLSYFREARYAKFIHYPQALHHLELLTESETFREAIKTDEVVAELARTQIEHWRTWRDPIDNELMGINETGEQKAATAPNGQPVEAPAV